MTTFASHYRSSTQSLPGWLILGAAAICLSILTLASLGGWDWLSLSLSAILSLLGMGNIH